jgi:uncharacterized protein
MEAQMLPVIQSKREELDELCRRFQVKRMELFGSAARGDFDPERSDLDFFVEFERLPPAKYMDAYFSLKEALELMFGRPVDLVSASRGRRKVRFFGLSTKPISNAED